MHQLVYASIRTVQIVALEFGQRNTAMDSTNAIFHKLDTSIPPPEGSEEVGHKKSNLGAG